jgi:dipeptidyl-peptidase III
VVVPSGKVSTNQDHRQGAIHLCLGFTAIVNKELSAKYETLVNNAPNLIKGLPWGSNFEVDVFKRPDFTALEVLSFATGGM